MRSAWRSSGRRKLAQIYVSLTAKPLCRFLYCLDRYLISRTGEVKKLRPPRTDFRLRCGDYRVFFRLKNENTIEITGVCDCREAYR